jgi:hypothetical protein
MGLGTGAGGDARTTAGQEASATILGDQLTVIGELSDRFEIRCGRGRPHYGRPGGQRYFLANGREVQA